MTTVLSAQIETLIREAAPHFIASADTMTTLGKTPLKLVKANTPEGEERKKKGWVLDTKKINDVVLFVTTS